MRLPDVQMAGLIRAPGQQSSRLGHNLPGTFRAGTETCPYVQTDPHPRIPDSLSLALRPSVQCANMPIEACRISASQVNGGAMQDLL